MTGYRTCTQCGRPMRPYGSKAADHPGTVGRGGQRCNSCVCASVRAKRAEEDATDQPLAFGPVPRATLAENIASFNAWLDARRKRLGGAA